MQITWLMQDAKNHFREVVELALHKGSQWVTRRGKNAVIVLSADDYRKINAAPNTLVGFFRQSSLYGAKLDLGRSSGTGRKVDL